MQNILIVFALKYHKKNVLYELDPETEQQAQWRTIIGVKFLKSLDSSL